MNRRCRTGQVPAGIRQRRNGVESILLVVRSHAAAQHGQRTVPSGFLCVPSEQISAIVHFLDVVRADVEVVGGPERPTLLDASAERIVFECGCADSGIDGLDQAVLEIPSKAAALGVGEGIAVCV